MDEWIVPAICVAGLMWLAMRAKAHDAAHGYQYWQPWRVFLVGGAAALIVGYAAIVVVLSVLDPGPAVAQAEAAQPHPGSAE